MQIIKIYPLGFAANTYFLTENGTDAIAIDAAQPRVLDEAKRRGLNIKYVLLTHGHYDHICGAAALQAAGAKVGCLAGEEENALGPNNLAPLFEGEVPHFRIDFTFSNGEELQLCGITLKVIATPGHTSGSACFLTGNSLFTGDTLFEGSVGRTDFPTGSGAALQKSVRKLYSMHGDCTVYAGHGEETTLSHERKHNGVIRG